MSQDKILNIGVFSPYVPLHLGGGERYLFDVALTLATRHHVSVGISDFGIQQHLQNNQQSHLSFQTTTFSSELLALLQTAMAANDWGLIRTRYEQFLGDSLAAVNFEASPLFSSQSRQTKLNWTKKFDVLYYLTDGSLFFSQAKKNILHIQFPFAHINKGLLYPLKKRSWQIINTNSYFTKQVVEPAWNVHVDQVHWPLIDIATPIHLRKKKYILHVGRFFRQLHSKRQDVLIDFFIELLRLHPELKKTWELVLIGSIEDSAYVTQLVRQAKGYPIRFMHQVTRSELLSWYTKASIYWHATGFGVDERTHPEQMEHFGITTVEAMAKGCVPIVIGKGGQLEILGPRLHELLWQTQAQCLDLTWRVIVDDAWRKQLAQAAIERAQLFGRDRFAQQLFAMVEGK